MHFSRYCRSYEAIDFRFVVVTQARISIRLPIASKLVILALEFEFVTTDINFTARLSHNFL